MRWPVVFSYARLRPAMVRSFPAPKPSTTVQNNAAGSTCRSRFTAPVERASATRNTVGNSLRRASRIGTAFSRAIGCSSSLGKPEVRSMARPSSQKAAIVAQIVRAGSLNRTPMEEQALLAVRAAPSQGPRRGGARCARRVAAHRVALRRERADALLPDHAAQEDVEEADRPPHQGALPHRA